MNDIKKVERHIKALMTHHGVGNVDFRFSKATRVIAAVAFRRVKSPTGALVALPVELRFSKRWAMVLPEQELWEVMIHEIAHIKTLNAGKPHGREFQRAVVAMGGMSTRRCFSPSVNIDGTPRKV